MKTQKTLYDIAFSDGFKSGVIVAFAAILVIGILITVADNLSQYLNI